MLHNRWIHRRIAPLTLALALVAGGAACTDADEGADAGGSGGGEEASTDEEGRLSGSISIGGIQSLTGAYASLGASMDAGASLAVDALQDRHPDLAVAYETCDDRTEVNASVSCYERFMSEDVSFLVGPALSAATAAVDPLIREDDVMGAVLGGGYGGATLNDNPHFVAALPSTQATMATMITHATGEGLTKAFMISAAGVLGDDCRSFWEDEAYADLTGEVEYLGNVDVDVETTDFAPTVTQVPDDAEFTFICLSGAPGVRVAAAYANAGIDAPMYGIHSQGEETTAGAYTDAGVPDGAIFVPSWCMKAALEGMLADDDPCADSTAELQEVYDAGGAEAPLDIMLGMTYDLTVMLAEVCASTDCSGDAMSEELFGGDFEFEGVLGTYTFGEDRSRGLDESNFLMTTLEGGSWKVDDLMALEG